MSRLAFILGVVFTLAVWWTVHTAWPQTGPPGVTQNFCGWSGAAIPPSSLVVTGTSVATRSVTNSAVLTVSTIIPTLSQGSVIGALISVRTGTIVERHDGAAPTNDSGTDYGPSTAGGAVFISCGSDLANLKMTANTGTAALVNFTFYGAGR